MALAASIAATLGPTPRTYITGVSRPGTVWMLHGVRGSGQTGRSKGVNRKRRENATRKGASVWLYSSANFPSGGCYFGRVQSQEFFESRGDGLGGDTACAASRCTGN